VKTLAKSLVGVAAKLIMDRFENVKKIPSLTCPLLIIHGKEDNLIPYQHAEVSIYIYFLLFVFVFLTNK